jgi:hypothetical protein
MERNGLNVIKTASLVLKTILNFSLFLSFDILTRF